jgi:hypothetical protein
MPGTQDWVGRGRLVGLVHLLLGAGLSGWGHE